MLTIIIDTREQKPLRFSKAVQLEEGTLSIKEHIEKLDVGDYSLKGFEDRVIIERKSFNDLLKSVTWDHDRLAKELRQFRRFDFAAFVIEASWPQILAENYGHASKANPSSVFGSIMSYSVNFGIQVIMADDHATAGKITERLLCLYAAEIEKNYKRLRKGD